MNISEHFTESLETVLGLQLLEHYDVDSEPGSKIFLTLYAGFGMEKFGCRINILDPQHCWLDTPVLYDIQNR